MLSIPLNTLQCYLKNNFFHSFCYVENKLQKMLASFFLTFMWSNLSQKFSFFSTLFSSLFSQLHAKQWILFLVCNWPFQYVTRNSPYYLSHNCYDVTSDNLVFDQLTIHNCIDIVRRNSVLVITHGSLRVNPLIPKSDWHLIFPYNITRESNIKVTRMKEMITNKRCSWFSNKLSL